MKRAGQNSKRMEPRPEGEEEFPWAKHPRQ
jgi:hypothetical protein